MIQFFIFGKYTFVRNKSIVMNRLILLLVFAVNLLYAQQTQNATRIFYEFSYKPKKDSSRIEKTLTILDITDSFSLYRDFGLISQDSILEDTVQKMQKSGVFSDIGKSVKWPSFSYKVKKTYPEMKVIFIDGIFQKYYSYIDSVTQNWKILTDTDKVAGYSVQKATINFGERNWTAWFTTEIPFQDGPYKFHGLPGLIVKIEDDNKNFSWMLSGVKKINDFKEISFTEELSGFNNNIKEIPREQFYKALNAFKQDPFAEVRMKITPEMKSQKMPGSDLTFGDVLKTQEERVTKFFNSNNNPIENH